MKILFVTTLWSIAAVIFGVFGVSSEVLPECEGVDGTCTMDKLAKLQFIIDILCRCGMTSAHSIDCDSSAEDRPLWNVSDQCFHDIYSEGAKPTDPNSLPIILQVATKTYPNAKTSTANISNLTESEKDDYCFCIGIYTTFYILFNSNFCNFKTLTKCNVNKRDVCDLVARSWYINTIASTKEACECDDGDTSGDKKLWEVICKNYYVNDTCYNCIHNCGGVNDTTDEVCSAEVDQFSWNRTCIGECGYKFFKEYQPGYCKNN